MPRDAPREARAPSRRASAFATPALPLRSDAITLLYRGTACLAICQQRVTAYLLPFCAALICRTPAQCAAARMAHAYVAQRDFAFVAARQRYVISPSEPERQRSFACRYHRHKHGVWGRCHCQVPDRSADCAAHKMPQHTTAQIRANKEYPQPRGGYASRDECA